MYTTRGYRNSSREHRKHSHQGQIIQRKPRVQIDNNPVVLEAYRKFFMGTVPQNLLLPHSFKDSFYANLADYGLIWTQSILISQIEQYFKDFSQLIFSQYEQTGKFPISLELYSPNLDDTYGWIIKDNSTIASNGVAGMFTSIIVDRMGNVSYTQKQVNNLFQAYNVYYTVTGNNATLAYGILSSNTPRWYGNPTQMKIDIHYYTIWKWD